VTNGAVGNRTWANARASCTPLQRRLIQHHERAPKTKALTKFSTPRATAPLFAAIMPVRHRSTGQ
jgi:hypothetical protein